MATKLSADVSQFKRAMSEAKAAAQALDSQMKLDEQTFKKTGDSQTYMANQAASLNAKLQNQQRVLEAANRAMAAMEKNGQKNSAAYNKVQAAANTAQYTINQLTDELNGAGEAADSSAGSMESMAGAMQNVSRRADFSAIISGLEGITSRAENAAKKMVQLGTEAYNTMKSAATWADDTSTKAMMEGMTSEEYQRMVRTAELIQTSVDDIFAARNRLQRRLGNEQMGAFEVLGIDPYNTRTLDWGMGSIQLRGEMKSWEDLLFEIGDGYKEFYTNAEKSAAAQELLGRSWQSYAPLWEAGRQTYEETMAAQNVNSEETVDTLSELSLALKGVKGDFETLEREVLVAFAPGLTELANSLKGVIGQFNEYLQTEEGQQKMKDLSDAVTGLFDGLKDVDFGAALDTAKGAIDTLISSLNWVVDNKDTVVTALEGIFGVFTGLKLTSEGLKIVNAVQSLSNLMGAGGAEKEVANIATELLDKESAMGKLEGSKAWKVGAFGMKAFVAANALIAAEETIRTLNSEEYKRQMEFVDQVTNTSMAKKMEAAGKNGSLLDIFNKLNGATLEPGGGASGSHGFGEVEIDATVDVTTSADDIAEQVGNVNIPATLEFTGVTGMGRGGGGAYKVRGLDDLLASMGQSHANGLEYVPYDGYVAALHKGERVLTAQEAQGYGQMDPAALADAMEYAMSHVAVYMGSDRVGNLTTNRVQANIQRKQNARLRGYGA